MDTKTKKQKGKEVKRKKGQRRGEQEYKDKYLRALADYQNVLKRAQKEREEFAQYANESFVEKLVSVLDHLERAQQSVADKGVMLVYKELWRVLKDEGLEKIVIEETDAFDPHIMECIEAEEGGKRLQIVRSGYKFKNKIIRPAHVKVVQ